VKPELDDETFLAVLEAAPLVSIDLIVTDARGRLLVGKRINDPAKGFFFVPGGRIRKDETLEEALRRIANGELETREADWNVANVAGLEWSSANIVEVVTHHYDGNVFGKPGVSTHYVVIAYRLDVAGIDLTHLTTDSAQRSDDRQDAERRQHSEYLWIAAFDLAEDCLRRQVHPNTLAYFDWLHAPLTMTLEQYGILNQRRDAANSLVWQTPVVGFTGLAFIFTVLLAGDTSLEGRVIAAVLAVVVCIAVIQLIAKQRFNEEELAREAEGFELSRRMHRLNKRRVPGDWFRKRSSVDVWTWVFVIAAVGAIVAVVLLPSR
jgi:colanic acid biosynthesis protein WcaH